MKLFEGSILRLDVIKPEYQKILRAVIMELLNRKREDEGYVDYIPKDFDLSYRDKRIIEQYCIEEGWFIE